MTSGATGGGRSSVRIRWVVLALFWGAVGVAVYIVPGSSAAWLLAWGLLGLAGAWLSHWRDTRRRAAAISTAAVAPDATAPAIPGLVRQLRRAAQECGHGLDATVYLAAWRLFEGCVADEDLLAAVRALVPDYGRDEFLLPVDGAGVTIDSPESVLSDYRRRLARRPGLAAWFREETLGEEAVLLPARWLCHLAGIRHRAVLIFLDQPGRNDLALMQVRSPNKLESPGCYDLPVAGHVPGLATPEAALAAEMAEELGLRPGDVVDLRLVGSYDAGLPDPAAVRCNAEYRLVYRGRVAAEFIQRVRFADGEVAALASFDMDALRALVATQPERVAPGLAESLYLLDSDAMAETPGAPSLDIVS